MNLAIEKGGSTDKNYVNAEGSAEVTLILHESSVVKADLSAAPRCVGPRNPASLGEERTPVRFVSRLLDEIPRS